MSMETPVGEARHQDFSMGPVRTRDRIGVKMSEIHVLNTHLQK